MTRHITIAALLLPLALPVPAQQSPSYRQEEAALNAGGTPEGGVAVTSSGFRVELSSLGDSLASTALNSPSFVLQGGFTGSHPASGEVTHLMFADETTLTWDPEPSVGAYNVYRDTASSLGGLGFGACFQPGVTVTTTVDTDPVPPGDAFFYLVTAENTLHQEGIKGYQSSSALRQGATCP